MPAESPGRPVPDGSPGAAVAHTHRWFDGHSGWAPPDPETVAEWLTDGVCLCPDECRVRPAEACRHGLASWWLVLVALDRPDRPGAMEPARLVPHPDRLSPQHPGYVAVMEAHHRAVLAGAAGYADPVSGLFALTARTLWDRGACCQSGCRHCPWAERP
ncbi:MAG TPA: DUF5522 domain-containing protein [Acidimicrobiales bacterium]|nr:DUF5522 domain-containing protein [Acidimicrobiales bacterium]